MKPSNKRITQVQENLHNFSVAEDSPERPNPGKGIGLIPQDSKPI